MIPRRVRLEGFLSYKDAQTIDFTAAPLWMLTGNNGSGKSAVFDALTFALFGAHRGGSTKPDELLNKTSSAFAIEFDFALDSAVYRIKRSLRRTATGKTSSTLQLLTATSAGGWDPVPDTGKKAGFDEWIDKHIGLDNDTFTSSVLLAQGDAEKLLKAKPGERAAVLARIVDLGRYQKLHDQANQKKLELKSTLESLSAQTAALGEVSELDYAAAEERIAAAEQGLSTAQAEVEATVARGEQARRWADVEARLRTARAKLATAEAVLGDAAQIEAAVTRLRDLRDALPAVGQVVTMRAQIAESQRKSELLAKSRDDAIERKRMAEAAMAKTKIARQSLQKQLTADETAYTAGAARVHELDAWLGKIRTAETQAAEVARLTAELAKFPTDPSATLKAAQATAETLDTLDRVLPGLAQFATDRQDLMTARTALTAATATHTATEKAGRELKATDEKLKLAVAEAAKARTDAEHAATTAQTLADQAQKAVDEFANLAGAKTCSACGQKLTKKHFDDEQEARQAAVAAALTTAKTTAKARATAVAKEKERIAEQKKLTDELDALRTKYSDEASGLKQLQATIERHAKALADRFAALPPAYQKKIATTVLTDWATTTYPTAADLTGLRAEAGGLAAAKKAIQTANETVSAWTRLRGETASAEQSLARLRTDLPPTPAAELRKEYGEKSATVKALVEAIAGAKKSLADLDVTFNKQGQEANLAGILLAESNAKLQSEEGTRKLCQDAADRSLTVLPSTWLTRVEQAGLADYQGWKGELDALLAENTEARAKQLEQARGGLATLRDAVAGLVVEADRFPSEVRHSAEVVAEMVASAKAAAAAAEVALRAAEKEKATYDEFRRQRAELGDRYLATDKQYHRFKILAELIGRDKLQRHLVRQAERQIVDYTNAVLDRLSSGQMFLRVVDADGAADKALDLECIQRTAGGTPIPVAFLSGSQRFRVAVSLALGIGRYASHQHRPIESVIIDEGFGCLDRQGRQGMIQELQNLRGQLKCILLVSHQEEFADAFPDGYRFELDAGSTVVTRFRR